MANNDIKYIVYEDVNYPEGVHRNCIVAREDDQVPTIVRKAYGPASKSECESWVENNCEPRLSEKK